MLESREDNRVVALEPGLECRHPREVQIILEDPARYTEGQEALQSLWSDIVFYLDRFWIQDECFVNHEPEFWCKLIKCRLLMVADEPPFWVCGH